MKIIDLKPGSVSITEPQWATGTSYIFTSAWKLHHLITVFKEMCKDMIEIFSNRLSNKTLVKL